MLCRQLSSCHAEITFLPLRSLAVLWLSDADTAPIDAKIEGFYETDHPVVI
jgi:hypothetical protein